MILSPRRSNLRWRNGVRSTARSRPSLPDSAAEVSEAGPLVMRVARWPGRAVAVDALNLDGRANLAIELGVAVGVLNEMTVDAVHSFFEVDVELVHRQAVAFRLGSFERGLLDGRGITGAISFLLLLRAARRRP